MGTPCSISNNIITFGSHDESLRVLVIIDLLMSLAVPTVPAVYALVQVPVVVGGAALQQVVLQLVFPKNEIGLDIIQVIWYGHFESNQYLRSWMW